MDIWRLFSEVSSVQTNSELWREFLSRDIQEESPGGETKKRPRGDIRNDSMIRLLDAAVIVVRAFGNLSTVTAEILSEQRDRLRTEPVANPSAPTGDGRRPIDLTY